MVNKHLSNLLTIARIVTLGAPSSLRTGHPRIARHVVVFLDRPATNEFRTVLVAN